MRIRWIKHFVLGIALIVGNACVTLLLAYAVGTILDTSWEFNKKIWEWHKTGQYPFPRSVLFLFPRIVIWTVSAEVAYQVLQTVVWGCNGYLLKRYAHAMKPVLWVWVPIVLHALAWDPPQIILGTASFYLMARNHRVH